jgi:hypothetical protein
MRHDEMTSPAASMTAPCAMTSHFVIEAAQRRSHFVIAGAAFRIAESAS